MLHVQLELVYVKFVRSVPILMHSLSLFLCLCFRLVQAHFLSLSSSVCLSPLSVFTSVSSFSVSGNHYQTPH